MTRIILAFAAILVVALSAGIHHNQSQPPFDHSQPAAFQSVGARKAITAELGFTIDRVAQAPAGSLQREDRPSPALLAYLALVLIGSAVAVTLVHRNQRREI